MTPAVEYGYRCDTCKRSARYGAGRVTAERVASRHHTRWPDHVVHLTMTTVLHTFTRAKTAVHQLGDDPPF